MSESPFHRPLPLASGPQPRRPTDVETVLVTGGSGYIAGWMLVGLLAQGYRVRTTLRNLARADAVRAAVGGQAGDPADRLSFFGADLLADDGWDAAVEGCDFVLHPASPMGQGESRGTDLVGPARDGTLRVLKAASRAGVRRVVMTSSTVAAQAPANAGRSRPAPTDETTWTDAEEPGLGEYARSKTLAERAAWDFMQRAGGDMSLVTILPGMVLGPVMTPVVSGSLEMVGRMLSGRFPALPRIGFSIVDTRDLVDLHLMALTVPAAAGQRVIAANEFLWMAEVAQLLRDQVGPAAAKVPTRRLPDLVLRAAALFQSDARFMAALLGRRTDFDIGKARRLFDWHPRASSQAVIDCARSLIDQGLT